MINMSNYKRYHILDNDFPNRSCWIIADNDNNALSKGSSELKTCNIRIVAVKKIDYIL